MIIQFKVNQSLLKLKVRNYFLLALLENLLIGNAHISANIYPLPSEGRPPHLLIESSSTLLP